MKEKRYLIILFIILTLNISCSKYLDKKSSTDLSVPTTLMDLQALLDDDFIMNTGHTASYGESSADDYFLLEPAFNNLSSFQQNIYKWIPNQNVTYGDWASCYHPVFNANLCLDYIKDISLNQTNISIWNNVKGSALFFRAYYFLQLAWNHSKGYDKDKSTSDLGIVLRTSSDFNIPSTRASVEDSYQQIIRDATESASYLPENPVHPMRPSKAAAYGLLARTYLSMRIYDSAWKYADLCLQIKNTLMDYNGDADVGDIFSSNPPFANFNKEVIFHTSMSPNNTVHMWFSGAMVDSSLFNSYAPDDLRKIAFFTSSGGYYRFKGNYNSGGYELFTGLATDEIYLIRAECFARMGDKDAALADLNLLLSKRIESSSFIPRNTSSVDAALQEILIERRKELVFRGLRWPDLKRRNLEGANIILQRKIGNQELILQPNANYYALPIPDDIIQITGMPQNPR